MTERRHIAALPWTALRAFEAAARLGSFKAAAAELAVTPTAISHQVKLLERHLGLGLFERLHRALRLTPAGEILAGEAQTAFAGLERTLDRLSVGGRAAGRTSLTVSVVPSLAAKWLAPRLPVFQAAHPQIGLRVVAVEGLVDFRRDATVDIAVRYGPGPYGDGVHAERLWPASELFPVCVPAVAADPALRTPADLRRHMLIRTAAPASAGRGSPEAGWPAWFAAAGIPVDAAIRRALDGPLFSNTQLAVEAAAAGRGIALASAILVENDIAMGRLVRLFGTGVADPSAFWLICRADRRGEAGIRAFTRWIRAEAAKSGRG